MIYSGGTVDENAVKLAGGTVLEGGNGLRVGGWVISSHKGPITTDAELEAVKTSLGALAAPEQFYGHNYLRLTHQATGASVSFTALDALKGWLADTSEPVRVGSSEDWMRARQADVKAHAAQTVEYDWTFTTSYAGSLDIATPEDGGGSGSSATAADLPPPPAAAAAAAAGGNNAQQQQQQQLAQPPQQQLGQAAAPAHVSSVRWEPTSEQINRGLLTSRDPILYYDELALLESELDDHGSSRVTVKVRVMPRCWYVLLRFWLRVDHVMVRLRETRVFCQFDALAPPAAKVLREVRYHEGTFSDLRAAGAPAEGPAYADADTASAALMAVAPVGVSHYRLEQLRL